MRNVTNEKPARVGEMAELFDRLHPLGVRYAAGELICREGSYAAGVQLILRGYVLEATEGAPGGSPASPELLSPGDLIGIEILLPRRGELHFFTCRSQSEVSLLFLDRASVTSALDRETVLSKRLVEHLADRHLRLRRTIYRAELAPVARLATLLFDLRSVFADPIESTTVTLPPAIEWKLLARLARVSPTQARQALQSLPGLKAVRGRLSYRPEELRAWLAAAGPQESDAGIAGAKSLQCGTLADATQDD
jgi:CRP-like cAMP-binding protein